MERLLPILATVVLTCFDHASLQSRITPSSLVTSTSSISTSFISLFSIALGFGEWFVPNTMLYVFEIFRTNVFLATHSETSCSSLLSVSVISLAVVADVYSVESSAYIDTLALFKASGMSLVQIEKVRGQGSCLGEFLILPISCWIGFHEITPIVFC